MWKQSTKPILRTNMSSKVFREITGTVAELAYSPSIINPPTPTSGFAQATYKFDVDGATIVGDNPLLLDSPIPSGAFITNAVVTIITASVGPTTMGLGVNSPYVSMVSNTTTSSLWTKTGGTRMDTQTQPWKQTDVVTHIYLRVVGAPHTAGNYVFTLEWVYKF